MFKLERILANLMVRSAGREQPKGYITLLYSPDYKPDVDKLNLEGNVPHWIQRVKDGEKVGSYWDRSGNQLRAIVLHADDYEAQDVAIQILSFWLFWLRGTLWKWKMAFLPAEPP